MKKRTKKTKPAWYLRWTTYFLLSTALLIMLFAWSEKEIETKQPSANWSLGVEIMAGLPSDFRLVGQSVEADGEGIAVAYYHNANIHLNTFDWYGNNVSNAQFPIPDETFESTLKLVKMATYDGRYYIYYSDRLILRRMEIEAPSLSVIDDILISSHAEQFDVDGLTVVAADDDKLEVFVDTALIAEYDAFEDVKRVCITTAEDAIIVAYNAADAGKLLKVKNGEIEVHALSTKSDQETYGYFKDLHLAEGVLTVVSSQFDHLTPSAPTVLGVWQLDDVDFSQRSFQLFYHVRTSLDPIISKVDGNKVSYILATQQTLDERSKTLPRYPQTRGGIFTNVSLFTRENDRLIENTRMTLTRQYPVGYAVFDAPFGQVFTWADKVGGKSVISMAGSSNDWMIYAKNSYKVNPIELVAAALMAMGNTIFFGVIALLISLYPYNVWIIGAIVAMFIYKRFAPFEPQKKSMHVMWTMILFVIGLKTVTVVMPQSDYRFFAHIYPWLFGNTAVLASITLLTSLMAVFMFILWKKQHYYYTNRFLQFSVFFGFELYLFLMSIMTFFVSAMMKNNFMM